MSVSSGTRAQFGYGIDNLYGGKSKAPAAKGGSAPAASSSPAVPLLLAAGALLLLAAPQ